MNHSQSKLFISFCKDGLIISEHLSRTKLILITCSVIKPSRVVILIYMSIIIFTKSTERYFMIITLMLQYVNAFSKNHKQRINYHGVRTFHYGLWITISNMFKYSGISLIYFKTCCAHCGVIIYSLWSKSQVQTYAAIKIIKRTLMLAIYGFGGKAFYFWICSWFIHNRTQLISEKYPLCCMFTA